MIHHCKWLCAYILVQNPFHDRIFGCGSAIKENLDIWLAFPSTQSNIQLPMLKSRLLKINQHIVKGLPLRFVDGHGKTQLHRKLSTSKWHISLFIQVKNDSWDEGPLIFVLSYSNSGHQYICVQLINYKPCSIAKLLRVYISQKHNWWSLFQLQWMWGKSRYFNRIKELF